MDRLRCCFSSLLKQSRGSSAVEFAMIAPILLLLIFGSFTVSSVLSIQHGLQQLSAEAARAALVGLSASERDRIARDFVASAAPQYAFLDPRGLTVSTQTVDQTMTFSVTTRYDLSRNPLFASLAYWLPVSSQTIVRVATIRQGGFP